MAFDKISEDALRTALASPNRAPQDQLVAEFMLRQARIQDAVDALDHTTATADTLTVALQTA